MVFSLFIGGLFLALQAFVIKIAVVQALKEFDRYKQKFDE